MKKLIVKNKIVNGIITIVKNISSIIRIKKLSFPILIYLNLKTNYFLC